MGIEIITRTRADCMHAPAIRPIHASAELVCAAVSQHAAFENRRCRETPLWKRCASRRSIGACRCLDRRGASFSPRAWRRHVVGTLPSFGATLPLPHPCPSSSPFSIGHDGFFRLHRLEPSRPRDAPPQHPMQPNLPQNPRTRMHQPLQIFISPLIARWTDRRRRLQPQHVRSDQTNRHRLRANL